MEELLACGLPTIRERLFAVALPSSPLCSAIRVHMSELWDSVGSGIPRRQA